MVGNNPQFRGLTNQDQPGSLAIESHPAHVKKSHMGVHGHGGTPIAGWVYNRKSHLEMDDREIRGTPITWDITWETI